MWRLSTLLRKYGVVYGIVLHNITSQSRFFFLGNFFTYSEFLCCKIKCLACRILLFVSPLLYGSLWTSPKSVASACLSIPRREQPLPQELWLLSVWKSVHHIVVRHGNMTSVRDMVLISLFCTLCVSNSLRFTDYVLMILLWRNKISFHFNFRHHLHRVAASMNRSGWLVWWLCKASLRLSSPFFFWSWFPHAQDRLECSLAESNFFCFSSGHICMALRWELFMLDHSSGQICPGPVVTCFFVCLEATCVLLVGSCWATRIVLHRSRVQTVTCLHPYTNHQRGLPPEVHQCSLSCVSGHPCNSEVSGKRASEHGVLFSEQHDSDMCNLR